MREDLDLRVIERHHHADPQFREAVRTRLAAILDGTDALEVPDQLPVQSTEEEATMIDLETPSQTDEHRKRPKGVVIAALLAAAAVVVIALVAIRNDDPESPADQPSPTVTAAPTVPPRALFGSQGEQFAPGTYYVDEVDGVSIPRIFITLADGWSNLIDGWAIRGLDLGGITFSRPDRVFSDACHSNDGFHPGPVTTLDGLVAALSEQGGWAEITPPTDITVNGYQGKTFRRTAPASFAGCDTSFAPFRSWENGLEGGTDIGLGWSYYEPGEIETLRVLDVDGTIIIVNTRLSPEHQDANAVARLAATLDTIRLEQT